MSLAPHPNNLTHCEPLENTNRPSTSTKSDTPTQYFEPLLYVSELTDMLNNDETIEQVTRSFSNDATATISFRYIQTMTNLAERMERDLADLQNERNHIFRYLLDNENFQYTILPVARAYRRWRAHPYAQPNVPLPSGPTTTSHTPSTPTYPTSNEHLDSPWTVTILSWPPSAEQESHGDNESPSSYHTVDSSQLPVLIHPTVRRPDTPHPYVGILRRTQSAPVTDYCTICAQTGHSLVGCIQRGPIICSYCCEVGHTRGICNNLQMDIVSYNPRLQYCAICEQSGHNPEWCFNRLFAQWSIAYANYPHSSEIPLMSSKLYARQVWNPWRLLGGNVTISPLLLNRSHVSSHDPLASELYYKAKTHFHYDSFSFLTHLLFWFTIMTYFYSDSFYFWLIFLVYKLAHLLL